MSSLAISPSGRPMQFALRLFPWLIAASAALSAQTLQQPDTTFSDGSNKVACYKQLMAKRLLSQTVATHRK